MVRAPCVLVLWVVVLQAALRTAAQESTAPPGNAIAVEANNVYRDNIVDGDSSVFAATQPGAVYGLQRVFSLTVEANQTTDYTFSTCNNGTKFPTLLILLNKNPFNKADKPEILSSNRVDVECDPGPGSLIEYRASGLATTFTLFIVVSTWDITANTGGEPVPVPSREDGEFVLTIETSGGTTDPEQPGWGLDRIDQRETKLDKTFAVDDEGLNIWIYVLDTGVRPTHVELSKRVVEGFDLVGDGLGTEDCHGHGTHTAAIAAGENFGVSRLARVVPVRVLDCANMGDIRKVVQGIDWVIEDVLVNERAPAVAILSLGYNRSSVALDNAVRKMVDNGISVVVAAGNDKMDACLTSPGSVDEVITVGSLDRDLDEMADRVSEKSNFGACVDLYAPGASPGSPQEEDGVLSAWATGDYAYRYKSGTSQAAPYVAGTVANLLEANPLLTPANVKEIIVSVSTKNRIDDANDNDNNRILFVRNIPKIELDNPEENYIYIYWIVTVQDVQDCELPSLYDNLRRGVIATLPETEALQINFPKCEKDFATSPSETPSAEPSGPTLEDGPTLTDGEASSRQNPVATPAATRILVTYQLLASVQMGRAVFDELEAALGEQQLNKNTMYELLVEEEHEPWVVDSRGFVYWAAPTFEVQNEPPVLSAGIVATIVAGCLAALCLVCLGAWLVNRRFRPPPPNPYEGMHATAEQNMQAPNFLDYQNAHGFDPETKQPLSFGRSFRLRSPNGIGSHHNDPNHNPASPLGVVLSAPEFGKQDPDSLRIKSRGGEAFAATTDGHIGIAAPVITESTAGEDRSLTHPGVVDSSGPDLLKSGGQQRGSEAFALSAGRDPLDVGGLMQQKQRDPETDQRQLSEDTISSSEASVGSARQKRRLRPSTMRLSNGDDLNLILMGDLNEEAEEQEDTLGAGDLPTSEPPKRGKSPARRSSRSRSHAGEEMLVVPHGGGGEEQIKSSQLVVEEGNRAGEMIVEDLANNEGMRRLGSSSNGTSSIRRAGSNPKQSFGDEALFIPGEPMGNSVSSKRSSRPRVGTSIERSNSFASEGSETIINTGMTEF